MWKMVGHSDDDKPSFVSQKKDGGRRISPGHDAVTFEIKRLAATPTRPLHL